MSTPLSSNVFLNSLGILSSFLIFFLLEFFLCYCLVHPSFGLNSFFLQYACIQFDYCCSLSKMSQLCITSLLKLNRSFSILFVLAILRKSDFAFIVNYLVMTPRDCCDSSFVMETPRRQMARKEDIYRENLEHQIAKEDGFQTQRLSSHVDVPKGLVSSKRPETAKDWAASCFLSY